MAPANGSACSSPSSGAVPAPTKSCRAVPDCAPGTKVFGSADETQLLSYFKSVASHLVNTRDDALDLDDGETCPVPGPDHPGPAQLPIDKRGT